MQTVTGNGYPSTGYSHYCYVVLLAMNLGEPYPDVFEVLGGTSRFSHYDSGVP